MLAEATRTFDSSVEVVDDGVMVEGTTFIYREDQTPSFILLPECDRCGTRNVHDFPFEEWTLFGATVCAQARATCRNCRFDDIAAGRALDDPAIPAPDATVPPEGGTEISEEEVAG